MGYGMFYSTFVAIIWPSMTLAVPKSATAMALGIAVTIQNVFMTSCPYYFGLVNKSRDFRAYNNSLLSLAMMGGVTLVFGIAMWIIDLRTGKLLSLPENDKRVLSMRRKM